jgi:carboxyl-terminal processing protease
LESSAKKAAGLPSCDGGRDDVRQPPVRGLRCRHSGRGLRTGLCTKTILLNALFVGLVQLSSSIAAEPTEEAAYSAPVQRLARILEQIRARYVRPIDDQKLIASALTGVLKGLDAHSAYLDAEAFRELQHDTQGEYGGLGLETRMERGFMEVLSVLESTPASRAGLQPGDRIIRVGDDSVVGMSLEQAIARVRGEPGTAITLAVLRQGEPDPKVLTLTREAIQGRSVESGVIDPGYAYVRLTQFQSRTGEMLAKDLKRVLNARGGRISGIILDLRDNPGGMLDSAVGVSAAFLPADAPVVITEGAGRDSNMRLYARGTDYLGDEDADYLRELPASAKTLPMVVLVNGESASAAEIVAGALQDNKRATILGTRTFGKGSIQTVIPFGDGTGMELTTAYYHTPSGRTIQGEGVMPDVVVERQPTAQAGGPSALHPVAAERQTRGPDLATAGAMCAQHDEPDTTHVQNEARSAETPRAEPSGTDCQLERALRLLRSLTTVSHR